jgi:hypothetical protein
MEVGEEEVVVDDDDVGFERLAAHGGDEAALPVGAGLAEAGFGAGVELMPERGVFGEASISARSPVSVVFSHCGDGVELRDLFEAGEERVVAQGVELVLAEVVAAALHVADVERAEEGFEEGDVLEEELLLEVFGAGGDDDALLALAGEAEGGQEVGEGLAGAGAGFDDEVALVGEGLLDGAWPSRTGRLAVLEGEGGVGEDAAGGEEVVENAHLSY